MQICFANRNYCQLGREMVFSQIKTSGKLGASFGHASVLLNVQWQKGQIFVNEVQ